MYKVRTTTMTVVSILSILFSVLAVCGSGTYILYSVSYKAISDPSMMATLTASGSISPTQEAQLKDLQSQVPPQEMAQLINLFAVLGLIGMVLYFPMFILGIGLWAMKKWAYIGLIIILVLHTIYTGVSGVVTQNFNIFSVVEMVIPVVMIAALLMDKTTSQQFMNRPPQQDNFGMDRF